MASVAADIDRWQCQCFVYAAQDQNSNYNSQSTLDNRTISCVLLIDLRAVSSPSVVSASIINPLWAVRCHARLPAATTYLSD